MPETIVNLDSAATRTKIANRIMQLRGMYRIDVRKYRQRRSDRQNRMYWPAIVAPFANYLREHGNEITNDEAHEILKHRFLRREVVDESTGERMEYVGSSAALDTAEFNEYLDKCAALLAECGIYVPEPGEYREPVNESQMGTNRPLPRSGAAR